MRFYIFMACFSISISTTSSYAQEFTIDDFHIVVSDDSSIKYGISNQTSSSDDKWMKGPFKLQLLQSKTTGTLDTGLYRGGSRAIDTTCKMKVLEGKSKDAVIWASCEYGDYGDNPRARNWESLTINYEKSLLSLVEKALSVSDAHTLNEIEKVFQSAPQVISIALKEFRRKEKDDIAKIIKLYHASTTIAGMKRIIKNYEAGMSFGFTNYKTALNDEEINAFITKIFSLIKQDANIKRLSSFYDSYPSSSEAGTAISAIFNLTNKQGNIAGYAWFIDSYPKAKEVSEAMNRMHELAWDITDDISTIEAYNDFILAYPTAKQVKQATEAAYDLEESEYTGFFSDEEKEARRLLVASKILEQSSEDLSRNMRVGYMIVVNRMNNLLKKEFNSTDAALRHLESNEFKSFMRSFKSAMNNLNSQLQQIADNTSDLSSIMKNQSSMMKSHFNNSAQDREMAAKMTEQHQIWERYIGEVGR